MQCFFMLWDILRDATYAASLGCYIKLDWLHVVTFRFRLGHFEVSQTRGDRGCWDQLELIPEPGENPGRWGRPELISRNLGGSGWSRRRGRGRRAAVPGADAPGPPRGRALRLPVQVSRGRVFLCVWLSYPLSYLRIRCSGGKGRWCIFRNCFIQCR